MGRIIINDKNYSGNSIVITNGNVIINNKDVTPESKEINISVQGNIDALKVDVCDKVLVTGNVKNILTKSGDVEVTGDIDGSIQTMSGDVSCGQVQGSISTMSGDVKHRQL